MSDALRLACQICRWRPPNDLDMALVQAHFDLEPDHDPNDIRMELVAVCDRCDLEMFFSATLPAPGGRQRHEFECPACHRTTRITQEAPDAR